jgi:hypothetical protein
MAREYFVTLNATALDGGASLLFHTGYFPNEALPRPSMGCVFSHELSKDTDFPRYVVIGSPTFGDSPAFLGHRHAPFAVSDPASELEMIRTLGGDRRLEIMRKFQEEYLNARRSEAHTRRETAIEGLSKLTRTPCAEALDLSGESDKLREAYGTGFGAGCLLARRLVERGVKFVEVQLGQWDTHADNFPGVRANCRILDPAKRFFNREGGLFKTTDGGVPIKDLLV